MGKEQGVCEINHETYYRNHPADQSHLYRTYENWVKDEEQMIIDEMSGNEENTGCKVSTKQI
ncbi:hypothetical protein N7539_008132 [Penicillium diatomitis]|uniref:Uncharacterized protein n=1 Tax=Penicillium diatomitis TaxID=2819901 RepID=A0A9W9WTG2_9EURO|nr:uncharacterized protein N7539_008132 [Penicillium diatomitis]KAJ5475066.1 hypothetical protein N7539_008132 [Penicillium diatomitis]